MDDSSTARSNRRSSEGVERESRRLRGERQQQARSGGGGM